MPIRFDIDHANRFVHARLEGQVTLADLEYYLDQVVVQDAMPYRKLYDSSRGTLEYGDDDVMAAGARISAYAALEPRGPVAVVAISDKQIDAASRILNLGNAKRPAKIFTSADAARAWLAVQPEAGPLKR